MIDLDKATEKLDKADNFLTRLSKLLKKHWLLLILISIVSFCYWAVTEDEDPHNHDNIENSIDSQKDYIQDEFIEQQYEQYIK